MRCFIAISTGLICAACGGSDYVVAEKLSNIELQTIIADCQLGEGDFDADDGRLTLSKNLEFERASCVLRYTKSIGKKVGPEVGSEVYVTPDAGQ